MKIPIEGGLTNEEFWKEMNSILDNVCTSENPDGAYFIRRDFLNRQYIVDRRGMLIVD